MALWRDKVKRYVGGHTPPWSPIFVMENNSPPARYNPFDVGNEYNEYVARYYSSPPQSFTGTRNIGIGYENVPFSIVVGREWLRRNLTEEEFASYIAEKMEAKDGTLEK